MEILPRSGGGGGGGKMAILGIFGKLSLWKRLWIIR